jgi:hypothetical protein
LTALTDAVSDWVNLVVAVNVTLTWPVAESCTSMVWPVMAAASP